MKIKKYDYVIWTVSIERTFLILGRFLLYSWSLEPNSKRLRSACGAMAYSKMKGVKTQLGNRFLKTLKTGQ